MEGMQKWSKIWLQRRRQALQDGYTACERTDDTRTLREMGNRFLGALNGIIYIISMIKTAYKQVIFVYTYIYDWHMMYRLAVELLGSSTVVAHLS